MGIEQEFAGTLLENLEHRATDLLRTTERLAVLPYPSEGPVILAKYLSEASKKLLQELEILRGRPYEEIESIALRRGQFLTILHWLLEYIAHADTRYVPAALVQPLEALVQQHVPNTSIIVRFTWDFNYYFQELAGSLRETPTYLPSLAEVVRQLPEFLPVFSFPVSARDDTLLHTAFGHEIGHFIGRVKKVHDKVPISLDPALLSQVDPSRHAWILKTIQSWYTELIADLVGTRLFGPACLLAFAQVILHALNEPGLEHPPPAMRLRLMLRLLEDLDYVDTVSAEGQKQKDGVLPASYRSLFFRYREFIIQHEKDPADPFFALVTQSVRKVEDTIKHEAASALGPKTYEASENVPAINALATRLKSLVPPDEICIEGQHRIPDLVSILNAGWLVYSTDHMNDICGLLSTTDPQGKAKVKRMVNGLLSKAIENVVIKRLWDKALKASG